MVLTYPKTLPARQETVVYQELSPAMRQRLDELKDTYGVDFSLVDAARAEVLHDSDDQPLRLGLAQVGVCGEVARRGKAEFIADEDPLLMLALPLGEIHGCTLVAVAMFLTRPVSSPSELAAPARAWGIPLPTLWQWAVGQPLWNAQALVHMFRLLERNWSAQQRTTDLQAEVEQITSHLLTTYEEISLLHRLTQNLKISRSETQLGELALEWLIDVLPLEGLAIILNQPVEATLGHEGRGEFSVLRHGACPIAEHQFTELVEYLDEAQLDEPLVLNHLPQVDPGWPFEQVRSLISVPLTEGDRTFGWMIAFNHTEGFEFGTVEASLLGSVGAILGIHSGNIDLYRQQADFLASVVRALTSAIDAKDPYTCGHSDRVARISMRLAQELGCDKETLHTIYLSGLLHDIGKIGIDDQVLRKAGKLTEAEYEHIKLHPELGYKILRDMKQLDPVLPAVLHHHEAWDGSGYPHKLQGEEIPFLARIVAVADSFDAMSSDRPYRKGMPFSKLEQIMQEGAGKQWDESVIAAFMAAREDIYEIVHQPAEPVTFDAQQWC